MKQEYPKCLYHAVEAARTVASRDEHEALGAEWRESPADAIAAAEPSAEAAAAPRKRGKK